MNGEDPHKLMAPNFDVAIAGSKLGYNLRQFVDSLEYESVDGIADEARLSLANPDFVLSDSKMWHPGNELDAWFGYGASVEHVGRVIITKPEPTFPSDGMPGITLKGYTKDQLMMQNSPSDEEAKRRGIQVDLISERVKQVATREAYGFNKLDVDDTLGLFAPPQKADMSDYEYVKGLANMTGYLFWVDYIQDDGWVLHFRDATAFDLAQEKTYTFEYNRGDLSTLLEFRPELSLTGAVTKLQAQVRIPESDKPLVVQFDDNEEAPDAKFTGDATEVIDETYTTAGAVVKLFFGDYAVEVVSDKKFKSEADLRLWAQQWFRRRRENFIIGRGTTIGIEYLRARQTHILKGLSKSLDGEYYFARVRHVFNENGYLTDFTARKLLK